MMKNDNLQSSEKSFEEISREMREKNDAAEFPDWEDVEREIFTPEQIAACDLKVAIIGEFIKARQELGLTQKKLEEISGVKQPVIARIERGTTIPQIDTLLKILVPLGKTLAIVPLEKNQ